MKKMSKKDEIVEILKTIYDPEISVNIYDLGLIYSIKIEENKKVKIDMTLTSANCPFAQTIPVEVRDKVLLADGVEDVSVKIVWDPLWGPDQMSDIAKMELNLF
jgi:FeS assembly SUF system protein|tara:strand:+ start:322 stop:633 length:312 start_codon:yes stop_codon:yes gene_type:complete